MARKFKIPTKKVIQKDSVVHYFWIDGYEANVEQRVGSGQVAFELLKNIEKIDKKNRYTIILPHSPLPDLPPARLGWEYLIAKPTKLWTLIGLPLALFKARKKPEVIFSPTHYIPRFVPFRVKRVVTIFDLAYLYFPQLFKKDDLYKLTNWTKYSILHANHIITDSKSAKYDIQKNYKIKSSQITVAYPGYNSNNFYPVLDKAWIEKVKQKYKIGGDYIVYLSTIQPRKNHLRLIEAMQRIDNLKLVIIGKTSGLGRQGWMYESVLEYPKKLGIEEKIIFTGFVPDDEVRALFNGAKAYICPSLYEGFGIPVVDAMACGLPVIVSNSSSLPEVAADAGVYIDPFSVDQIEQAIRTVVNDKKLHAKLSKKSLFQAKKFFWEKMARAIIRVLEEVA